MEVAPISLRKAKRHDRTRAAPETPEESAAAVTEANSIEHQLRAVRNEALVLTAINESLRRRCAQLQQEVDQLAGSNMVDPFLGVATRSLFSDRLRTAIGLADRSCRCVGLLRLRFQIAERLCGQEIAAASLREVARRLARHLRESDTLCRLESTEFVVLLPEIASPATLRRVAENLAATWTQQARPNFEHARLAHVAKAFYPANGATEQELLSYLARQDNGATPVTARDTTPRRRGSVHAISDGRRDRVRTPVMAAAGLQAVQSFSADP